MATKTSPAPAGVDPGVALLEEARAHRRQVERRLVDGEEVTAADLAAVDHEVGLAEARVAAAEVRRAEEAEAAKRAIIRPILDSLTDGHLDAQARLIMERYDQAAAAIAALHAAASEYVEGLRGAAMDLFQIDRAAATRPAHAPPGELIVDRATQLLRLPDGRRFWFKESIPDELVAEAAGVAPYALAKVAGTQQVQKKRTIGRLRDTVHAAEQKGTKE